MGGDVFVPSALIASAGNNANEYLAKHVAELGYLRPTIVASGGAGRRPRGGFGLEGGFKKTPPPPAFWPRGGYPRRRMGYIYFEVVIINTPLPDEFGHELSTYAVEKSNAGVILLAKAGTADQISDKLQQHGVLVLAKPFTGVQFRQAVQMAAACCRRLDYLRQENDKLRDKIAQIRLVDRAKCYLIEHKGMSEAEAHRMIEKTAMDTRRDRAEVAAEILEEE